jgi:archaellin
MRWKRKRNRYLLAAVAAAVVAPAAYAFTAANTVPNSNAGSGAGTISGYTVSNVSYTLNATNPQNVDQVAFTVSPTSGTVKVQVVSGGSWYACTNSSGSVTCATTSPQATAAGVNQLTVVAAQ